jgi:hypothetical protein
MSRLPCLSLASCLALALACNFDGGGVGSETATDESSSTGDSTDGAASESGTASMSGDGDGDPGDGDPGDGDPGDGDPGDGDGDGDTGDGDGDGDTGDGDGDTGDGDGDTGDGDGDTGDGDGDLGDYYGNCPGGQNAECLPDEYCFVDNFDGYQTCSQNCNAANDCPSVPEHTIKCIFMNGNLFQKRCFISCDNNQACPMGMKCEPENAGIDPVCVYDQ